MCRFTRQSADKADNTDTRILPNIASEHVDTFLLSTWTLLEDNESKMFDKMWDMISNYYADGAV